MRTRAEPEQGETAHASADALRPVSGGSLNPTGLVALQRSAGNQAVTALVRSGAAPAGMLQRFLTEGGVAISDARARAITTQQAEWSTAQRARFWEAVTDPADRGTVRDYLGRDEMEAESLAEPPAKRPREDDQSEEDESEARAKLSRRSFDYESETARTLNGASIQRPVYASGIVHPTGVPARGFTATPLAYAWLADEGPAPDEMEAEEEDEQEEPEDDPNRLLGYDGGHLIGLHLGGENVDENVVPMFPAFNRGIWKNMEDGTKAHIAANRGVLHRMTVELTYTGPNPEVPTTLTVSFEEMGSRGGWQPSSLGSRTFSQPDDIVVTQPLPASQVKVIQRGLGKRRLPGDLHEAGFETGDLTFGTYVNTHRHMPPGKRPLYPDDPDNRPYEVLDLLEIQGARPSTGSRGSRWEFGAAQRELILQVNMARNGGRLVSDDPHDPQQDLDERGTANAPEIDHIVPKSSGGSNFFSNARVVSWQLNNKVARIKPLAGLVDMSKRQLPVLQGANLEERASIIVDEALMREGVGMPSDPEITSEKVAQWGSASFNQPASVAMILAIRTRLRALADEGALVLGEQPGTYLRA